MKSFTAQIVDAGAVIMEQSAKTDKVTHFQGKAEANGKISLHRRVWNLLAKSNVFSDMAAHPVLMTILRKFPGTKFIMGSIVANRLLPGGPGQELYIDTASADMRQLLGLNYPCPSVLDAAQAGNAEGRT